MHRQNHDWKSQNVRGGWKPQTVLTLKMEVVVVVVVGSRELVVGCRELVVLAGLV